ncbi:MAG: hypothetical protein JNL82_35985 [Myxococcales bacterium]|nr:hypothetical protein [Myxococcales bacterium]
MIDALVLTALADELRALFGARDGAAAWSEVAGPDGFPYHQRRIGGVQIAAAWVGAMGETATAARAAALIGHLDPRCLAMAGICAGNRAAVSLGDVIIADRVYSRDHGKIVTRPTPDGHSERQLLHDITTYNLDPGWRIHADHLTVPGELHAAMLRERPLAWAIQEAWLCHALAKHAEREGPVPQEHQERKARCPDWPEIVHRLVSAGLVRQAGERLLLTAAGKRRVQAERSAHPDGLPPELPFRVHIGAIATGKTVERDGELFARLERMVCRTLGVEMEAAAIGHVAETFKRKAVVVKAVSDHGDAAKDDRYRGFAARAAATVLLALLERVLADPGAPAPEVAGNPFKTGGTLPADHRTYVVRGCDEALEAAARAERLCAVEGDFGTGKSSLVTRVGAELKATHRVLYVDLAAIRGDDVKLFMSRLFKKLSRELGRTVEDWSDLAAPGELPVALVFDEFKSLTREVLPSLIPSLIHFVEAYPPACVIVCLPVAVGGPTTRRFLADGGVANPKHRECWRRIEVPRFSLAEVGRLLDLLSSRARGVARAQAEAIRTRTGGIPVQVQRLCSALYEAEAAGKSDAELRALITAWEANDD